ncbi:MAG TPA: SRPBCC family protein [Actinomycetota bacterium]|nr:SRPBCC family protein [Actinomycetota bacterium]
MAEQTEGTILIEAEPEDVMEVLTGFDAYPEWAGVEAAEVLERDDQGRGAAVAFRVSQMGFDAAYTLEYEYAPDDAGMSWTTREAQGALKEVAGEYVLEESGEDTRVTYRLALDLAVAVPSMLRRRGEKAIVKTALEGLKRRVEEG